MLFKKIKCLLLLAVVFIFSTRVHADLVIIPTLDSDSDDNSTLTKEYISDFPNEIISVQGLDLELIYNDVVIPGDNGMDIVIERRQKAYNGGRFHITYGSSVVGYKYPSGVPGAAYPTTNFDCLGNIHKIIYTKKGRKVNPTGYANASDIPSNTLAAFDDGSVLVCDGSPKLPTLIFPDGRKYIYAMTGELIEVRDRFGNSIQYGGLVNNKKTIIRNDGQIVELIFGSGSNSLTTLTKIKYNNKTLEYKYNSLGHLETFVDTEGRETTYTYSNNTGGYALDTVTTPEGLFVDYHVNPYLESSPSGGGTSSRMLTSKTISGPSMLTREYTYHRYGSDKRTLVVEYDYNALDTNLITEYYNHDHLKKIKIYKISGYVGPETTRLGLQRRDYVATHSNIFTEDTTWETITKGNYGCEVHANPPFYGYAGTSGVVLCSDVLKKSRVTSLLNSDGSYSTYSANYTQYNQYNNLSAFNETFGSNSRYIKYGYTHDTNNWVLNKPTTTELSSDGSTYSTTNEIEYYPSSHASYPLLPKYDKSFGVWKKYYKSYHANGNIEKIEYNQPLSVGTGNIYEIFSGYKRGKPQLITTPARYSSEIITKNQVVDNNGNVIQSTDLEGHTTNYGFDNLGRLKFIDPADTAFIDTLYSWGLKGGSSANQPSKKISRCTLNSAKTACSTTAKISETITYDALMRTVLLENTDGINSVYQNKEYNLIGQLSFTSFNSSNENEALGTSFTYDNLQRVKTLSVSHGGTLTTSYLSGNKRKINDFNGNDTTTTYLAYGAQSYNQATLIQSPEGVTTSLSVNVFGEVESVTQSGSHKNGSITQTQINLYNSVHQLCMVKRNDVGNTFYQRDSLGQVEWQAEGVSGTTCSANGATTAQKSNFGYDNLGSLHTVTYGDASPNVIYTLDKNGNVTSLTSGSVSQTYGYNSARLLEWEMLAIDSKSFLLDYEYDMLGHLSALTYPDVSVGKVSFAPNAFGQATKSTSINQNYAAGATYYPNGVVDSFTFGNGFVHKTTLNNRNFPANITDASTGTGGVTALNLAYTYDYQNNVKSITDSVNSRFSLTNLTYDGLDRLISTTGNAGIGDSDIVYDALGNITNNRTLKGDKNSDLTYTYNKANNRLTGISGTGSAGYNFSQTDSYDTRGNITNNGMRDFEYNLANQMTDSDSNHYVYDGYNRRVKTSDSKGDSYSMYSQSGRLLYREVDGGPVSYIFLGDKLIAKDGVISTPLDSNMHYKPFGDSIEQAKDEVGYTGHKFDTDLGLSYMQARYYDPVIGRFYSNDPVGYTAKNPVMSFNRYMYVNNNPYKYNDPDGKLLNFVIGAAVGAAIEAGIQLATTGTIDGDSVMAAAAVGAVTGGVGGLLAKGAARGAISAGEAIAATASTGGIANGIATATTNPNATAGEIATSMVLGAAGAGAGAKIANKAVSKLESMSKAGGIPGHIASTTRTGGDVAGKTSAGAELGKVAADTISNAGTKAASCSSTNSSC